MASRNSLWMEGSVSFGIKVKSSESQNLSETALFVVGVDALLHPDPMDSMQPERQRSSGDPHGQLHLSGPGFSDGSHHKGERIRLSQWFPLGSHELW